VIIEFFSILGLALVSSVTFSMVSRSRNRDNTVYFVTTAMLSNMVWFVTMRHLIVSDLSLTLLVPYVIGSTTGALFGMKISMFIERKLHITSDGHLKKKL
jgi:uncharacterized membrane protein YfcA